MPSIGDCQDQMVILSLEGQPAYSYKDQEENINLDLFVFWMSLNLKSTFILFCSQWLTQMKQELTKENKNENIMVKHSGFAVSKKREEKKLRACQKDSCLSLLTELQIWVHAEGYYLP